MPPLHPAVVHFPIALVTFSVVTDVLAWLTGNPLLGNVAWWALAGATLGAALAIVAGLSDMAREHQHLHEDVHHRMHTHMKVGLTLFTAIAVLTVWRTYLMLTAVTPGWGYLIAALVVLVLTMYQAWLGGELVFRYGAGVLPTGQAPTGMTHSQVTTAHHGEHSTPRDGREPHIATAHSAE